MITAACYKITELYSVTNVINCDNTILLTNNNFLFIYPIDIYNNLLYMSMIYPYYKIFSGSLQRDQ